MRTRSLSLATTTLASNLDAVAALYVCSIIGLPKNSTSGFPGKRDDAILAGITASAFLMVAISPMASSAGDGHDKLLGSHQVETSVRRGRRGARSIRRCSAVQRSGQLIALCVHTAAMNLEAGLKKDDSGRPLRRSFTSGSSNAPWRYEHWLKCVSFGFLGAWVLFVLFYWSSAPDANYDSKTTTLRNTDSVVNVHADTATKSPTEATFEAAFPQETNFIVMGDYGTGSPDQVKVADTLKKFVGTLQPKPAFVVSTGDQVYDHGLTSPEDPVLKTRFEKMYASPDLQVPWYIALGNHDCEGSIDAVLKYATKKDSLWYFPRRYYSIDRPVAPKTLLRLVVLDVCDLVCGQEPRNTRCTDTMNKQTSPSTRTEQYQWVEKVLSQPKPAGVDRMWKIVVGHWGVYSFAGNADTAELIKNLDPMLQKYRVHAYLSGHDHCMQHIKKLEKGWTRNYFVSGAGGYRVHDLQPKARESPDLVHAAMTHGFMWMHVTDEIFRVQLINKTGEVLYTTDVQYE
ncbi:TPA: hypothetical protein N0F65_005261 [Lagenidium giganteum]|uniref:Calcineurin-like phosphoesterase domain-containing protein n=1 Tax=Lagenidium giganteum TaxID=4803 RepID=A0AAV2Z019_9STRA|nr:TPA: hypothetical protein N0F65_005261 [Lagenidium giganteum]